MAPSETMKQLYTVGDLVVPQLDIACTRCPRKGRLAVARLIAEHGAGCAIRASVASLNQDCPR
jgi:hypothetical protein